MFVEVTVKVLLGEAEAVGAFLGLTSAHCKACTC